MILKLSDFGLSRNIVDKEYYRTEDTTLEMPVRWMSPESLTHWTFTTKSDVVFILSFLSSWHTATIYFVFDIAILVSVVIWCFAVGDLHFWGISIFIFVKSCFAQPFENREQTKQTSSSDRQQNVGNFYSFSLITSPHLFSVGISKHVFLWQIQVNAQLLGMGLRHKTNICRN